MNELLVFLAMLIPGIVSIIIIIVAYGCRPQNERNKEHLLQKKSPKINNSNISQSNSSSDTSETYSRNFDPYELVHQIHGDMPGVNQGPLDLF
jgi:hypothetical protein